MGIENPLLLMGGDFESIVYRSKIQWGFPKFLMLFPVGIRVQCSFPVGIKFQGIFLTGDQRGQIFGRFFQWGGVPTGSVTRGCYLVGSSVFLQLD